MAAITKKVGKGYSNVKIKSNDVKIVQRLLDTHLKSNAKFRNAFKKRTDLVSIKDDGQCGDNTIAAIEEFQRITFPNWTPDGYITPGKGTWKALMAVKTSTITSSGTRLLFPLKFKPLKSYKSGMRAFGSNRSSGKRKHAGVDLYAPPGTSIRAIKDGTVIRDYPFYLGTRALEIDHGDMVVRYGEVKSVATGIKAGATVKRGDVIAYVGQLVFKSGNKMSMLHIEFYKGTKTGPLTVRNLKPYQRRADLFDPTSMLDVAVMS